MHVARHIKKPSWAETVVKSDASNICKDEILMRRTGSGMFHPAHASQKLSQKSHLHVFDPEPRTPLTNSKTDKSVAQESRTRTPPMTPPRTSSSPSIRAKRLLSTYKSRSATSSPIGKHRWSQPLTSTSAEKQESPWQFRLPNDSPQTPATKDTPQTAESQTNSLLLTGLEKSQSANRAGSPLKLTASAEIVVKSLPRPLSEPNHESNLPSILAT